MCANLFGFLNIYKPKGITSFDVIYKLRKILGIKKIGHAGTLDPLAEGVLPVAVGNASRLIEYLEGDKAYEAKIFFGANSTTYDDEGEKTEVAEANFSNEEFLTALPQFLGKIKQIPPVYSAIKIGGKKLYELARAGKEEIKLEPRDVEIYDISILEFNLPYITISVSCSSGTYIRSLAYDLGVALKTGAYIKELKRTKSNGFEIKNSIKIEDAGELNIQSPLNVINFPVYNLSGSEYQRVKNGNSILVNSKYQENQKIFLCKGGQIIALATYCNSKFSVDKVLNIC